VTRRSEHSAAALWAVATGPTAVHRAAPRPAHSWPAAHRGRGQDYTARDGCGRGSRSPTAADTILARTGAHWALAEAGAHLRITVVGSVAACLGEARAARALTAVFDAGGWAQRVLRCATPDCANIVIDTTNSTSRTLCAHHARHRRRTG